MIEIVPLARTVASIQKTSGGSFAAFSEEPILEWLTRESFGNAQALQAARDKFIVSCAGQRPRLAWALARIDAAAAPQLLKVCMGTWKADAVGAGSRQGIALPPMSWASATGTTTT